MTRVRERHRECRMEPTNKKATPNARKLFHDLDALKGKGILTGQHTQTVKMEEIDEIKKITGKEPALRGFELLAYSPNIRYETGDEACRTEIDENKDTIAQALAFGRSGGIVTFTWHWFSPVGGQDKSFYSRNTDFDPEKVLIEGTPEREAFYRDMDVIAGLLKPFLEEDIPILWRPFHESEGTWFWWGSKGPAVAAKLFRMQYEYFVGNYGLHNLLWVWNCPDAAGYPGDDVVDIFSCDLYEEKGTKTDYAEAYEKLRAIMGEEKPVALAEIGILPDMELLKKSRIPWRYYMTWSKDFVLTEAFNSHEDLRRVYESAYTITNPWKRGE